MFRRLLLLFSLSVLGDPNFSQDEVRRDEVRNKVARLIAKTRDEVELRRNLVFIGKDAIPPLFEVWQKGRVPRSWRTDADYVLLLDERQMRIVVAAFDALPEKDVNDFLGSLASNDSPRDIRIKGIKLLGEIGDPATLRLLGQLATPFEHGEGSIPRVMRGAFGAALARLVERDVVKTNHLRELFLDVPVGLMATIVQSLGAMEGPGAARSLAALLGRQPKLDPLILSKIASRERSSNPLDDEDLRTAVRALLRSADPMVLASAARTSGVLGDEEATEELVSLVAHRDASVRLNAGDALKRITGLDFRRNAELWANWYEEEMRWWDTESSDVLLALETAEGVELTRAIVAGLKRRLHRHRIAESLVLRLRDQNPDQVRLACAALAQLRASFAVRELIACLEHSESRVREAAHKALLTITEKNLPLRVEAWREAFER